MPEVGAKMPSQITNNNAVYPKFCAISNKQKKLICTRRLPRVFFSLLAYFKTNETKKVFRLRSASFSATFGTSASSFEETAPDAAPDKEKIALRRTLQPNKNAVISKIAEQ